MLFTSLAAAVTVLGLSAGTTPATQPKWQPDYATAARTAAAQQKPLAVFVGRGAAGLTQLVAGGLPADATKALGDKFVSVYVDADTPAGRPLAAALKVTDGLVISDKTGSVQALRHSGPVHPVVLANYLTAFADAPPVTQTVQAGAVAPVMAAPVYAPQYQPAVGGCAGGNCGGGYVGGYTGGGCVGGSCGGGRMMSFPSFGGGGCAGGSCGGGRMGLFR